MAEWKETQVSEFLKERVGRYKPNDPAITKLKRLDKIDFSGGMHFSEKPSKTNMIIAKKGDLVISGINVAKGALALYDGEEDITATIHYSSYQCDDQKIDVEYFKRFLKSQKFIQLLKDQVKGGIKTEIKPKHLLPLKINLPDVNTQKSIVALFQRIESKVDDLNIQITKQHNFIIKLRQSILQEAVEGKLTAEWRTQNPELISGENHAERLLEKIKAEKERLVKDGKIKKQKELPPIREDEKPFELPEGWGWCRIGNVTSKIGSGSTPKGGKDVYVGNGIKFFRSQNVHNDGIHLDDIVFIDKDIHRRMSSTSVFPKDILLNITGGSIGRAALIPNNFDQGNVSQHVSIVRPVLMNQSYMHKLILSPYFQKNIFISTTGAGREGLPKYNLETFIIPFPPFAEQQAIVEKVDRLMAKINALEKQVTSRKEQAEQLMHAVLREAFDGA